MISNDFKCCLNNVRWFLIVRYSYFIKILCFVFHAFLMICTAPVNNALPAILPGTILGTLPGSNESLGNFINTCWNLSRNLPQIHTLGTISLKNINKLAVFGISLYTFHILAQSLVNYLMFLLINDDMNLLIHSISRSFMASSVTCTCN